MVNLHLKNVKLAYSHLDGKLVSESVVFAEKNILWIEKFEKSQISNQLSQDASDFQTKNLLRVKVWIELPHSVRKWIKIFPTHQTSFKKLFSEKTKLVVKLAFRDSFSWSIYTVKTSMLDFLCILGKVVPETKWFLFIKKILDQIFWR